jgi:hypothetical protein
MSGISQLVSRMGGGGGGEGEWGTKVPISLHYLTSGRGVAFPPLAGPVLDNLYL